MATAIYLLCLLVIDFVVLRDGTLAVARAATACAASAFLLFGLIWDASLTGGRFLERRHGDGMSGRCPVFRQILAGIGRQALSLA